MQKILNLIQILKKKITKTYKGKKKEKVLYLKKHKITTINNKITIIVDEKPTEVGVDPYNKLIDSQSEDNRKKL